MNKLITLSIATAFIETYDMLSVIIPICILHSIFFNFSFVIWNKTWKLLQLCLIFLLYILLLVEYC